MTKREGRRFYITTAIDYVNNIPHIGTAYEKICADVIARFKRLEGFEVRFQMGNDEHSINVKRAALERGLEPQRYCDAMQEKFESIWKKLCISYDGFIRTTSQRHKRAVQKLFKKIYDKGDIYKSLYAGYYCESCEAFYAEKDLVDGCCPHHQKLPKWLEEENYFFALSRYQERLLRYIEEHPEFILPETRRNEIVSLVEGGLEDVSVSRSTRQWGIPLPIDRSHVVYVWFDALINYIAAVGYGWDEVLLKKWWPADLHVIGKDITRFHCVIWPAMLMSAGMELPKTVFGHGFVYLRGEKMSKSLGNVVVPMDIIDEFGPDPLRYFLLRESSFGKDGDFTWERFIDVYNSDLANGIGNTLSRTVGMIVKYCGGKLERLEHLRMLPGDANLRQVALGLAQSVMEAVDYLRGDVDFHIALGELQGGFRAVDRYIQEQAPWRLSKAGDIQRIREVLANVVEALRIMIVLLRPFVPQSADKMWANLGFDFPLSTQDISKVQCWKAGTYSVCVSKGSQIFPRIEETRDTRNKIKKGRDMVYVSDFEKLDIRIAQIVEAVKIEGADRLLKLQVDLGSERRQIVAGIAATYSPEELIGRKVVVIANLKPVTLKGVESQGMLLAATDGNELALIEPSRDVAVGARVK